MKKKLLSTLLVGALAIASLTGCGAASAGATGAQDTLAKVVTSQKLTVACILTNEPFGTYDEQGNPIGYDVDIAYMLAESLGIPQENVEIINTPASERITALESGKADVVIGNFTRRLDRAQKVQFTNPYNAAAVGGLVLKGNEVETIEDLEGKVIYGDAGTTNEEALNYVIEQGINITDIRGEDSSGIMQLDSGKCDITFQDSTVCAYMAMKYPDKYSYCFTDSSLLGVAPFYDGLGVRKDDQNWLNYLNTFVYQINLDGRNAAAYEKWFGSPRTICLTPDFY